jgi:hypothetical protein
MIFLSIKSTLRKSLDQSMRMRQSLSRTPQRNQMETQSQKIRKNNTVTIAIVGHKAYWVHQNIFYETEVVDGEIDRDSARPIDAHNLSKNQFNELLEILDSIS